MRTLHILRVVFKLSAGVIALAAIGCANSPVAPSSLPVSMGAPLWSLTAGEVAPGTLAQCLGGTAAVPCFTAARVHAEPVASANLVSAPVLNNNQPVLNSGSTVTLAWTPPAVGVPLSYAIEASSVPGGAANLANFNTGNAATSLVALGVPPGTYVVRVRGLDASGAGAASNEVQLVVGGASPG